MLCREAERFHSCVKAKINLKIGVERDILKESISTFFQISPNILMKQKLVRLQNEGNFSKL